ncbi:MAG: pyridoxal-phosphate dependent enzyme [Patescibacteria group bacterium]|nr:pyridoxal-phosphate dependent enzyme [Patescibacteria group bacterium]
MGKTVNLEGIKADPVFRDFDPEGKRFLDVRWLPQKLNPFMSCGIRIGAVVIKGLPHIKAVAAVQMMLEDFEQGLYLDKHTIVVPSSGNTAHAVARIAPAFGFEQVKVVMAADVPASKKEWISMNPVVDFVGVGGGKSVEDRAREVARQPGHVLLDQYGHMGNMRAHEKYTAPELVSVLGVDFSVVAIALGSGGTAAGVGRYLRTVHTGKQCLGVRPALGERVPGARDEERMKIVTLPWEGVLDGIVEVSRKESFARARQLWSAVEPQPGPSSGLAYAGLLRFLRGREELKGTTVGFICPDKADLYSGLFSAELDTGQGLLIQI